MLQNNTLTDSKSPLAQNMFDEERPQGHPTVISSLKSLSALSLLPISLYHGNALVWSSDDRLPLSDSGLVDMAMRRGETTISLHDERNPFFYIANHYDGENVCLIGPFVKSLPDFDTLHRHRRHHHIHIPPDYSFQTPSVEQLLQAITLSHYFLTGRWQDFSYLETRIHALGTVEVPENTEESLQNYRLDASESDLLHFPYQIQREALRCIKEGDWQGFLAMGRSLSNAQMGKLAYSELKQTEYAVVAAITLCNTAAIEGGVNQYAAYDMNDMFLQRLSLCRTSGEMTGILGQVYRDYLKAVGQVRSQKNTSAYVENAKSYMSRNLNKPLTADDIAAAVGISKSRLMHLFTEKEGESLIHFLYDERIRAAQNMLKYSAYSIAQIADYFYFSSPSHFCHLFKQRNKMTPGAYRKKHRVINFS